MSADRRQFLTRLTASGLALSTLPGSMHAMSAAPAPPGAATGDTDWREHARASAAGEAGEQPPFDVSWAQRVTGKHKAVFDVPEINGGSGVWRAGMWRDHNRDLMQAQPSDLSPVIVIRHAAIPLVMNHEFWDRYDIAKSRKVMHPMTDKKTRRNPVLMTAEDDELPPSFAVYALDKQMANGTIVVGCNMAFGQMVSIVRRQDKLDGAAARTRALAMMVPGVILQPNGIFGVTLAQEVGCAFVAAS